MKIFVETERFLLRELLPSDVEGMFALDSDPEVHKYIGNHPITSLEQAEEIIDYVRRQYVQNGIGRWAIEEKSTGEFVGWTGLKLEDQVRPGQPYYDLGYRLRQPFWGKGIATETGIASLEYGFNTLELPEICGAAHIHNLGSNKVLSKVGMQLQSVFNYEGATHNWYVLDIETWRKQKTKPS